MRIYSWYSIIWQVSVSQIAAKCAGLQGTLDNTIGQLFAINIQAIYYMYDLLYIFMRTPIY